MVFWVLMGGTPRVYDRYRSRGDGKKRGYPSSHSIFIKWLRNIKDEERVSQYWETQVYSQALGVCQDDIARVDSLCLVLTVAMAPMPFAAPFLLEGPESCPCHLPVCARDARAYVYSHRM